mmetsp:Transcript_6953/g.7634  ORF Transcript_6953/g.7634 Transcript_6953/m.7634 type:complete len:80 (+) Transcript_6953:409-648(+)
MRNRQPCKRHSQTHAMATTQDDLPEGDEILWRSKIFFQTSITYLASVLYLNITKRLYNIQNIATVLMSNFIVRKTVKAN